MIVKKSWIVAAFTAGIGAPASAQVVRVPGAGGYGSAAAAIRPLPEFQGTVTFDNERVLSGELRSLVDDLRRLHTPRQGARPVADPRLDDKASHVLSWALAKLVRLESPSAEERRLLRHYLDTAAGIAADGAGQEGLLRDKAEAAVLFIDALRALAVHDAGLTAAAREAWAKSPALLPAGVSAVPSTAGERAGLARRILDLQMQTFR